MTDQGTGDRKVLTIEENLEAKQGLDNTEIVSRIRDLARGLYDTLTAEFPVEPIPASEENASYTSPDGRVEGSLNTMRGGDLDYLVYSWMEAPELGFLNLHLNTWVGAHTKVPHLAIVFGTIPDLFVYFDYVPRADLTVDMGHLDRYFGDGDHGADATANERWLAFMEGDEIVPFVSKSVYMRQAISPVGLCMQGPVTAENVELLASTARSMMDHWIGWMREGDPVPEGERGALAARDQHIRRAVAERDPANSLADRILGKELADRLVHALWGVDEA